MLSILLCPGVVGPACIMEQDYLGKIETMENEKAVLLKYNRIPTWKDKRFCYYQQGQACVPVACQVQDYGLLV